MQSELPARKLSLGPGSRTARDMSGGQGDNSCGRFRTGRFWREIERSGRSRCAEWPRPRKQAMRDVSPDESRVQQPEANLAYCRNGAPAFAGVNRMAAYHPIAAAGIRDRDAHIATTVHRNNFTVDQHNAGLTILPCSMAT